MIKYRKVKITEMVFKTQKLQEQFTIEISEFLQRFLEEYTLEWKAGDSFKEI